MGIGDTTKSKKPCSDKANHILSDQVKPATPQAQLSSITALLVAFAWL